MGVQSRKPTAGKNKEQEKAPAWINLSVVGKSGKPLQVGGIPLTLSKALHKELMDRGQELLDSLIKNGKITLTLQVIEQHEEGESFFD